MHPDGAQRTALVEPVAARASDYWRSPQSGAEYPMTYRIQIPELEADLTVKTAVDNQELYFPENPLYNRQRGIGNLSGTECKRLLLHGTDWRLVEKVNADRAMPPGFSA